MLEPGTTCYLSHPRRVMGAPYCELLEELLHVQAIDPCDVERTSEQIVALRQDPQIKSCCVVLTRDGGVGRGSYDDLLFFLTNDVPVYQVDLTSSVSVLTLRGPILGLGMGNHNDWTNYARPVFGVDPANITLHPTG